MDDFAEIVRAAQAGDRDALEALWRAANPRLLRFLQARAPGIADDVASESWIRIARGLDRFSGNESDFRAWMFTIARRTLIDFQRRSSRRPEVLEPGAMFESEVASDDASEQALDSLSTDAAIKLVRQLSPDQADVILLRVVAGLDVRRVAQILGKREAAVRVLQHRGLRRLATLLGADQGREVTK